jgi:tetratricopeptide (TPR) repeat protein
MAATDYQKSIDLDSQFIFSHIQLGVTQYKMGSIASSMATFRRCIKNFGDKSDVYNYYGELLLDQQKYQEAVEKFETAVEMEKKIVGEQGGGMNVLPLINKALALFQWKQDFSAAEDLCQKALISKFDFPEYHFFDLLTILQSTLNATSPLPLWLSSSFSKARSPTLSSTSSAPPSFLAPRARLSTPSHTPKRRARSSRSRRSTPSLRAGCRAWVALPAA